MIRKERIIDGLNNIKKLRDGVTDEQALECPSVYPDWNGDGREYVTSDRVLCMNKLYKCLQAHTSQSGWTPVTTPSLWAEILAGQDGTAIGEWVQPDSTNPYMTGDRVIYNGKTWESTIDNNVWSPDTFGWKEVQS